MLQMPINFTATCFVKNEIATTSYVQLFIEENSFNALNSSCSQLSFIINSSKIRMVCLSITDFEKFKAQIVEEYRSASKFITDARGRLSE